jgi:DNA-binding NarL/FixJ family response regulator
MGLRGCLAEERQHLIVVGEASDGLKALTKARKLSPDVLVVEVEIPKLDGLSATSILRKEHPEIKVVVWSSGNPTRDALKAIRAGAHGYVHKKTPLAELAHALATVGAGESYFRSDVAGAVVDHLVNHRAEEQRYESLTPREREVLVWIATGLSNIDMAGRLGLSGRTVETYRRRLEVKLNLHGAAALTRFAVVEGLISLHTQAEG